MRDWITGVQASTAFVESDSPWQNGYAESFNGKLRDELLSAEVFNTLAEAKVLSSNGVGTTTQSFRTPRLATGRLRRT